MNWCDTCLFFLDDKTVHGGQHCAPFDPDDLEKRAAMALTFKRYRLAYGAIWFILNDDPDNWQDVRVATWDGTKADAFRMLMAHNFPTSEHLDCRTCHQNPVEFLGDDCYDCHIEANHWANAGERA